MQYEQLETTAATFIVSRNTNYRLAFLRSIHTEFRHPSPFICWGDYIFHIGKDCGDQVFHLQMKRRQG